MDEDDTKGRRTLDNITSHNINCTVFNSAKAWRDIKEEMLINGWKKLLHNTDGNTYFGKLQTDRVIKVQKETSSVKENFIIN
jgi:hypothetical protein